MARDRSNTDHWKLFTEFINTFQAHFKSSSFVGFIILLQASHSICTIHLLNKTYFPLASWCFLTDYLSMHRLTVYKQQNICLSGRMYFNQSVLTSEGLLVDFSVFAGNILPKSLPWQQEKENQKRKHLWEYRDLTATRLKMYSRKLASGDRRGCVCQHALQTLLASPLFPLWPLCNVTFMKESIDPLQSTLQYRNSRHVRTSYVHDSLLQTMISKSEDKLLRLKS